MKRPAIENNESEKAAKRQQIADIFSSDAILDSAIPLTITINQSHEGRNKKLVENGQNVNQDIPNNTDSSIKINLNIAARMGIIEIVKNLLKQGADVNEAVNGITPLFSAIMNGHTAVVKELLQNGAAANMKTNGLTPLRFAAQNGQVEIVKQLIMLRIELNLLVINFDKTQETLHAATMDLIKNDLLTSSSYTRFYTPDEYLQILASLKNAKLLTNLNISLEKKPSCDLETKFKIIEAGKKMLEDGLPTSVTSLTINIRGKEKKDFDKLLNNLKKATQLTHLKLIQIDSVFEKDNLKQLCDFIKTNVSLKYLEICNPKIILRKFNKGNSKKLFQAFKANAKLFFKVDFSNEPHTINKEIQECYTKQGLKLSEAREKEYLTGILKRKDTLTIQDIKLLQYFENHPLIQKEENKKIKEELEVLALDKLFYTVGICKNIEPNITPFGLSSTHTSLPMLPKDVIKYLFSFIKSPTFFASSKYNNIEWLKKWYDTKKDYIQVSTNNLPDGKTEIDDFPSDNSQDQNTAMNSNIGFNIDITYKESLGNLFDIIDY